MAKIDLNQELEITTPYKKKKVKNIPKKADHKHEFKPFIGIIPAEQDKTFHREHRVIAEECTICGKQRIKQYFITIPSKDNLPFRTMISGLDEIKGLYPEYEVKEYTGD